jgi:hypothetical protein
MSELAGRDPIIFGHADPGNGRYLKAETIYREKIFQ